MEEIEKKVAVITGASKGIGKKTAQLFAKNGYTVYGLARTSPKKEQPFTLLNCDVTDKNRVDECLLDIFEKEGRIDVLVNNAGMGVSGAVEHIDDEKFNTIMSVNACGVVNCSRAAIPYLRKTKGYIVNISSIAAVLEIPFQAYYTATKSFVLTFSKALRNELRPLGVKVTAVLPGDTKTSFTESRKKDENLEGYGERLDRSIKRMEKDEQSGMNPCDVAKVILKTVNKKNPPPQVAVGFQYKLFLLLKRFLPEKLISFVLYKMYAE